MVRIISIFPLPLTAKRPLYSPVSNYEMPAAPPDGFVVMNVVDQTETDYLAAGRTAATVVRAEELALDLIRSWQRLTYGDGGEVGVFLWPYAEEPTVDAVKASPEYADALQKQNELMRNIVIVARTLFKANKQNAIGNLHFTAAAWLQIEGEEWQGNSMSRDKTKECIFCRSFISAGSVICAKCGQIVDPEGHVRIQKQIADQINALQQQATLQPDNAGSALRPATAKVGK